MMLQFKFERLSLMIERVAVVSSFAVIVSLFGEALIASIVGVQRLVKRLNH